MIDFECLFLFNDLDPQAISALEKNLEPLKNNHYKHLKFDVKISNMAFETFYPDAKRLLKSLRYKNVLFNIDPCGPSVFERTTLVDILRSFDSAEIFLTFMIQALVSFLRKTNTEVLRNQVKSLNLSKAEEDSLAEQMDTVISDKQFLGAAEQIVYRAFRNSAAYVSMFSINNPSGWQYWLIHFANNHRARQVYNDVLHEKSNAQAHFGRSGLSMLSYDPRNEDNMLYLFGETCREKAKAQLFEDIPDFIGDNGEAMTVMEFYRQSIAKPWPIQMTLLNVLHESDGVEVLTEAGNARRRANAIKNDDIIIRARQTVLKF